MVAGRFHALAANVHCITMSDIVVQISILSYVVTGFFTLQLLKFSGCYHGHADSFLVQAGSGVATLGLPDSPGVPAASTGTCIFHPCFHWVFLLVIEGIKSFVFRQHVTLPVLRQQSSLLYYLTCL